MTSRVQIGSSDGASSLSRLPFSFAAAADNVMIPAVANQIIRLYRLILFNTGANTMSFRDGTGGTFLSGGMDLAANAPLILTFDGEPYFVTSPSNALVLALSAATKVAGTVYFTQTTNLAPP